MGTLSTAGAGVERSGLLSALIEYFSLRRALEVHHALDGAARKRIADALAIGRQKADAAEALWSNGHAAEGLRLAVASLEATVAALPAYAHGMRLAVSPEPAPERAGQGRAAGAAAATTDADATHTEGSADNVSAAGASGVVASDAGTSVGEPAAAPASTCSDPAAISEAAVRGAALRARGVDARRIAAVEAALDAVRNTALPALDAEISPSHAELFQQVAAARLVVDRALCTAAMERRELLLTRAARSSTTAVLGLLVLAGVWLATRTPEGVRAEASAVWANAPAFSAETVIDGRPETYWLLPDGQSGWVEVRMSPPRRIEHVRVLNSHNPPHGDRATRDYRIEFYSGSTLLRGIDASFEYTTSPEPVEHAVGLDDVDRIRFVVRSHYRTGGGLAELSWD